MIFASPSLSEYDLQSLLREIDQIRLENRFLDPDVPSDEVRININVGRLTEIKVMAQRHIQSVEKAKRHLKIVI